MVFKLAEYFVGQFNCMHPQDMGDRSCSECLFDRQIPRVAKTYYYLQRSTRRQMLDICQRRIVRSKYLATAGQP